jgi:hypothetical protein
MVPRDTISTPRDELRTENLRLHKSLSETHARNEALRIKLDTIKEDRNISRKRIEILENRLLTADQRYDEFTHTKIQVA